MSQDITPPPIEREVGRLEQTFGGSDVTAHGPRWDQLWKEAYTPWDRGGPSLALRDLIVTHSDLIPASSGTNGRALRALVPGCGRGYDVLLLSALGYDTYGLDYSADAVTRAKENQREVEGQDVYQPRDGVEKGTVTWLTGDFFADDFVRASGAPKFDLIFDYTFFCALPPDARPHWASRMSQLLANDGRLVCLEWPLGKPPSENGPPWGVTAEAYALHLSHPVGETAAPNSALLRLDRIKPDRTHKAGINDKGQVIDFISVWAHK